MSATILNMGVANDIIDKSGSWFSYQGRESAKGGDNARRYIEEHPEMAEEVKKSLRKLGLNGEKSRRAGGWSRKRRKDGKSKERLILLAPRIAAAAQYCIVVRQHDMDRIKAKHDKGKKRMNWFLIAVGGLLDFGDLLYPMCLSTIIWKIV